jgi:hypothetical protein
VASEKRRGGIEGPLQLRRSLHHGERLPARKSLAAQLIACRKSCESPPGGEAPPSLVASAAEVAARNFDRCDPVYDAADPDEADEFGESDVFASLE